MRITLSILALVLAHAAAAQQCTTLTYVGAPLTSVVQTGYQSSATVNSPLVGSITLESPLGPNLSNAAVTLAAWDFTSVYPPIISSGEASWQAPIVSFSTDANGNITDWNMAFGYSTMTGNEYEYFGTSTPAGDTVNLSVAIKTVANGEGTIVGSNSSAGTWICPVSYSASYTAPPPPPTPVNPLAATVAALQAQVAALTAQNATLQAQAASLTASNNQIKADESSLVTEYRGLEAYWTATIAAQKVEIADLTAEVEKLKK